MRQQSRTTSLTLSGHSTFRDIRPYELASDGLRIHVPNSIARDKIERRYRHLIEDVLTEITGQPLACSSMSNPSLWRPAICRL